MTESDPPERPLRADGEGIDDDFDSDGFDGDRHRILREVVRELGRHPVVVDVRGHPPSTFTEVRATLAPERWGHDAAEATLRVTWRPLDPPEFAFHYSEPGFDCGWHREPNPHVDGDTAVELVWEITERLRERLDTR